MEGTDKVLSLSISENPQAIGRIFYIMSYCRVYLFLSEHLPVCMHVIVGCLDIWQT